MLVTCVRRFATGLSPPKVQRVYKPTFDRYLLVVVAYVTTATDKET